MSKDMLTISQLAKKCGISRTTVLYYERQELLLPSMRSDNGYRWYGPKAVARLEAILAYRSFGLPVTKLATLLDRNDSASQESILLDQFNALEKDIQQLRLQQKAIVQFIEQPELLESDSMTKARWVQIMRDAGLTEEDMINWHKQFEKTDPAGHQRFLESLDITEEEIKTIRSWSQEGNN